MGPDDPPASNLNSADCFQNPYVTFVLTNTGLWGQMKGLATWTSYFEAHSFSLAFVSLQEGSGMNFSELGTCAEYLLFALPDPSLSWQTDPAVAPMNSASWCSCLCRIPSPQIRAGLVNHL